MRVLNQLIGLLIQGSRPFLGPAHCIYPVSCGQFALEQLAQRPLGPALWAIIKRLCSCIKIR